MEAILFADRIKD